MSRLLPSMELHLDETEVQLALFGTPEPGSLVLEKLKQIGSVIGIEQCPFNEGNLPRGIWFVLSS